jgi:hypothetical protein
MAINKLHISKINLIGSPAIKSNNKTGEEKIIDKIKLLLVLWIKQKKNIDVINIYEAIIPVKYTNKSGLAIHNPDGLPKNTS